MTTYRYVPFTLELQSPAIVTTLSGDPNSSRTQPFIPGAAIRGAAAKAITVRKSSQAGTGQKSEDDIQQLILSGNIRYLHAYPAGNTNRSLPSSCALRTEKETTDSSNVTAYDLAAFSGTISDDTDFEFDKELIISPENTWPSAPLSRSQVPPFLEVSGARRLGVAVQFGGRIHQQRDRNKGRPWLETTRNNEIQHGAIFSYEFLESGQTFKGFIQIAAEDDATAGQLEDRIRTLLADRTIHVGRSRRAGYGGEAQLRLASTTDREANWGDVVNADLAADSLFRAALLSSCIIRDPDTGQIDPMAFPQILVDRLGGQEVAGVERVRWEYELVGGFNRKWRLELPQMHAVCAGSVLVLRAKRLIPVSRLREIEHQGLGERRVDGFGRVLFLRHSEQTKVTLQQSQRVLPQHPQPSQSPSDKVRFLQERLLDAHFNRWAEREVGKLVTGVQRVPSPSLLGRLRVPIRSTSPTDALKTLHTFLENPRDNHNALKDDAQKKLQACRLSQGGNRLSLKDWLGEVVSDLAVSNLVKQDLPQSVCVIERDDVHALLEQRNDYYAARLIDALLETLARIKRRSGEENDNE